METISSYKLVGLDGTPVEFHPVPPERFPGSIGGEIKERAAREVRIRAKSALHSAGAEAKTCIRVTGWPDSGCDMAAALALTGHEPAGRAYFGELSLGGEVRAIRGILARVRAALRDGWEEVVVPVAQAPMVKVVWPQARVFPAACLDNVLEHELEELAGVAADAMIPASPPNQVTMDSIEGLETVKAQVTEAVAAKRTILLIGPPGSGKTMIARRIASLMPQLTLDERDELAVIHDAVGLGGKVCEILRYGHRPFRAPHHTVSAASMLGMVGAPEDRPRMGELTIAHRGVLFLDEVAEFRADVLSSICVAASDKEVTLAGLRNRTTFPCDVQLVVATMACPCGYLGDPERECVCSPDRVNRYAKRLRVLRAMLEPVEIHVPGRRIPGRR
jgi:magnesium chelatase family protein